MRGAQWREQTQSGRSFERLAPDASVAFEVIHSPSIGPPALPRRIKARLISVFTISRRRSAPLIRRSANINIKMRKFKGAPSEGEKNAPDGMSSTAERNALPNFINGPGGRLLVRRAEAFPLCRAHVAHHGINRVPFSLAAEMRNRAHREQAR